MDLLDRLLAGVNVPTMVVAVVLVLLVLLVIKIGRVLLFAAVFGGMAAGVSLGQGSTPATAGTHAAIAFGVAAVTMFLVRMAKGFLVWLLITALGVAALLLFDVGRLGK